MSTEDPKSTFLESLRAQIGIEFAGVPHAVRLDGAYTDVVYRIGQVLPFEVMLDWFTSSLTETGGERTFPYCRIDSQLLCIDMGIEIVKLFKERDKKVEWWKSTTKHCAKVLTWVDIGWGGVGGLAAYPLATRNWTSGSGHFATAKERVKYIVTEGEKWINEVIAKYAAARQAYGDMIGQDDPIRQYQLEPLLAERVRRHADS